MKNETFLENLEMIVGEITNSTDFEVLYFKVNKPAPNSVIDLTREKFFSGNDNSLLEFYRICNGLQLIWSLKGDTNVNINFFPLLFLHRAVKFQGVINLLPVEIAFNSEQWKDTVWFEDDSERVLYFIDGEWANNVIKKKLIPVDYFSVDMSMAVYPAANKNFILLLKDYHIDYDNSYLTFWEDYLDFIIRTKGEVKKRYKAFNKLSGFKNPPLNYNQLLENL
jgi:hypothetical protein